MTLSLTIYVTRPDINEINPRFTYNAWYKCDLELYVPIIWNVLKIFRKKITNHFRYISAKFVVILFLLILTRMALFNVSLIYKSFKKYRALYIYLLIAFLTTLIERRFKRSRMCMDVWM